MARKEKPKLFSVVGKKVSHESRNTGKVAHGDSHFALGIYYFWSKIHQWHQGQKY